MEITNNNSGTALALFIFAFFAIIAIGYLIYFLFQIPSIVKRKIGGNNQNGPHQNLNK